MLCWRTMRRISNSLYNIYIHATITEKQTHAIWLMKKKTCGFDVVLNFQISKSVWKCTVSRPTLFWGINRPELQICAKFSFGPPSLHIQQIKDKLESAPGKREKTRNKNVKMQITVICDWLIDNHCRAENPKTHNLREDVVNISNHIFRIFLELYLLRKNARSDWNWSVIHNGIFYPAPSFERTNINHDILVIISNYEWHNWNPLITEYDTRSMTCQHPRTTSTNTASISLNLVLEISKIGKTSALPVDHCVAEKKNAANLYLLSSSSCMYAGIVNGIASRLPIKIWSSGA